MLHIAICDDDKAAVKAHQKIAETCLKRHGSVGEFKVYTTSDNLLYDICEDHFFFDLILLDIEMPGSTGMELAKAVKPYLPNVKIIFITSHVEYAIDAFELSIFRYVPKNDIEARLPAAIRDAVSLIELEDEKAYTIQTNSRLEKIPYKESIISNVTGNMPPSLPPAGCPRYGKACSKSTRSLTRMNSFISTGAAS